MIRNQDKDAGAAAFKVAAVEEFVDALENDGVQDAGGASQMKNGEL